MAHYTQTLAYKNAVEEAKRVRRNAWLLQDISRQDLLKKKLEEVAPNNSFYSSLLNAANTYGSLTEKQETALRNSLDKQIQKQTEAKAESKPIGSMTKLIEFVANASKNVKKLSFQIAMGNQKIKIFKAGINSKYNGNLMLVDNGVYPNNKFFGRIDKEGNFYPDKDGKPVMDDLMFTLQQFAQNPAGMSKAYGQRFGQCCFCAKELTTKESIYAGYGPICAEKFGLPWGETE